MNHLSDNTTLYILTVILKKNPITLLKSVNLKSTIVAEKQYHQIFIHNQKLT